MPDRIEVFDAAIGPSRFQFEGFGSLVWPRTPEEFFERHWESRPFFVPRNEPGFFDSLLTLGDIDEYLGTRAFHAPDIRLVKQGKDTPFEDYSKDGVADRAKLMREFRCGTMLLFAHLNRHHLPLAELVSRCEAEVHVPMRSNVYLSPPGSTGFKLHWDTHDVLVLQVSGRKRWHLYDNPLELPHEEHMRDLKGWIAKATKLREVEMQPGSVLFLPRGFIHGAQSEDEHSLHITLGFRSLTVADIVLGEFRRRSLEDLDMRRVARLDDFDDDDTLEAARAVLQRVVEGMDIEGAANDVYRSFIRSRQPPAQGGLLEVTHPRALNHDSPLRLRPHALFHAFQEDDRISLAVDGMVVNLPAGVEQALTFVREQDQFTPGALPGIEFESRLILARTLLECRLLEHVQ